MPLTLTSSDTAWVTLDEAKAHANIPNSAHDAELILMIEAAQDIVEGLIGPVLWRTVTETRRASWGYITLTQSPVISITSVTTPQGASAAYTAEIANGTIWTSLANCGDFTITYVAGRSTVPAAVRMATLIIAGHLWQTQLGNSPGMGAFPTEEELGQPLGSGYAIPNRARDLLMPYMHSPLVA